MLEDLRSSYGLMFAGAMRFGEAAARTWRDDDRTTKPPGRPLIHSSSSTRLTALASLLERWHVAGWESAMGRPPQPSDLKARPSRLTWAPFRSRSVQM